MFRFIHPAGRFLNSPPSVMTQRARVPPLTPPPHPHSPPYPLSLSSHAALPNRTTTTKPPPKHEATVSLPSLLIASREKPKRFLTLPFSPPFVDRMRWLSLFLSTPLPPISLVVLFAPSFAVFTIGACRVKECGRERELAIRANWADTNLPFPPLSCHRRLMREYVPRSGEPPSETQKETNQN